MCIFSECSFIVKELLNNKQYRKALRDGVYVAAYMIHIYWFSSAFPEGSIVTDRDMQNSIALCNNAVNLQLSEQQQVEMVHRSLEKDPYVFDNYMKFICRFPKYGADFVTLAKYCNITAVVQQTVVQVTDYVKQNLGTTEADAKTCRMNAIALINQLGLRPNDCPEAFQLLNAQDAKLDQEYRTVKGVVLNTRQEADSARKDLTSYEHILEATPNFLTRGDYLEHIKKIEELAMDSGVKKVYIQKYQVQLTDFDKKCRKAKRFDYILAHDGLPFRNGDKKDQLIHYGILAFFTLYALSGVFRTEIEAEGFILWMFLYICYALYMFVFKIKSEKGIYLKLTRDGQYTMDQIVSEEKGETLPKNGLATASVATRYKTHVFVIIGIVILGVLTLLVGGVKAVSQNGKGSSGSVAARYSSGRFESQKVLDQLSKAMKKSDGEAVMSLFLSDSLAEDLVSSDYANTQQQLDYANLYATSKKVSFDVTAETELDDATIRSIEESYLTVFGEQVNIEKGYLSTVQIDAYGTQKTAYVQAIYIRGDGWKLSLDSINSIFGSHD